MPRLAAERPRRAFLLSETGPGRRRGRTGFWVQWLEPAPRLDADVDARSLTVAARKETVAARNKGAAVGRMPAPTAPRWRRRTIRLDTLADARAFAERKTAELNAPIHGRIAWKSMVDAFASDIENLRDSTAVQYLATLELFVRLTGLRPMADEITPELLRDFFRRAGDDDYRGKTRAADTLHKHRRHLRRFIRFGLDQQPPWWAHDPLRGVRLPPRVRRLQRAPSIRDAAAILRAAPSTPDPLGWWLYVRLSIETGLRQDDLVHLPWSALRYAADPLADDPDAAAQVLVIDTISAKKLVQGVWVLTPAAEAAVETRRLLTAQAPSLLGWPSFQRPAWRRLLAAAEAAPWTAHDLRRAAATAAQRLAMADDAAARLLQHGSAHTTRLHYLDALVSAAAYARELAKLPLPSWADCAAPSTPPPPPTRSAAGRAATTEPPADPPAAAPAGPCPAAVGRAARGVRGAGGG